MKALCGVEAIRMAALMYARHGKTVAEFVAFVQKRMKLSRREIIEHAWDAGAPPGLAVLGRPPSRWTR